MELKKYIQTETLSCSLILQIHELLWQENITYFKKMIPVGQRFLFHFCIYAQIKLTIC